VNTTAQRSSIANLPAWFLERFPLVNVISAFVMYFMIAAVARQLLQLPMHFQAADVMGSLGLTGFFLLMRVSDEFKDFALDSQLYPQRILQSGQIELKHLLGVGAAAALLMLGVSFAHHGFAPWLCVLNLALVGLLNREFFAKDWLHKHILFCAFSHMLVAATASLWVVAMMGRDLPFSWPLVALLALPYFSGLSFELARKCFGAEENREGLESYTRVLGIRPAIGYLMAALLGTAVSFAFVVGQIFPGSTALALGISFPLALIALISAMLFIRAPSKKGRKLNEALGGLFILGNYLVLIGLALWN
jgi:hypothetical protein